MSRSDQRSPLLVSVTFLLLVGGCSGSPEQRAQENRGSSAPTAAAKDGAATIDPARAREELIQLEQSYSKALISKDRTFLESYYATDFRGGNWMGFWTKSTMLKAVLDDRYSVRSMDLSNLRVRIVGTIGIVQGVSTEVTRVNGRDTSGRWSFTDVFEFRDGRWIAIASHTSELKPDKAD
jgi:hypothetical protein